MDFSSMGEKELREYLDFLLRQWCQWEFGLKE